MTDDLLSRLTAVVDEAERKAKAASTLDGNGEAWFGPLRLSQVLTYPWGGPTEEYPQEMADADAAHIAACDPEDRLRHVEHARRVMARHVPIDLQVDGACCTQCVAIRHGLPVALAWPCADLLDLAAAWGVTE